MGYAWNENDAQEELFFHNVHDLLDCSVERFWIHLDQTNFLKTLFLHRNITYYLVCLTLYTIADVQELYDNLDKCLLYRLMSKSNCDLLKRRILCKLKHIIGDFAI